MLKLPMKSGWIITWYTGEVINFKSRTVKICDSFESASKKAVLKKKKELEDAGFEIEMFTECIL